MSTNSDAPKIELTKEQRNALDDALQEALVTPDKFKWVIWRLGENPDEVIPDRSEIYIISMTLIRWAEAQSRLADVVRVARESNPGNPKLKAVAEELGLLRPPESKPKAGPDTAEQGLRQLQDSTKSDQISVTDPRISAELRQEIGSLIEDLDQRLAKLRRLLAPSSGYAGSQASLSLTNWWQQGNEPLRALHSIFQSDPGEGLRQWLKAYAEAMVAWDIRACARLINESFPLPPHLKSSFRYATQAMQALSTKPSVLHYTEYDSILEMLGYLIEPTPLAGTSTQPLLDEMCRAALLIFAGRIHLYRASDGEPAGEKPLRYFERAREAAPTDGRANAALAEYYRIRDQRETALTECKQAIKRSPNMPDGYLVMGLLSEDKGAWSEAADMYARALREVRTKPDVNSFADLDLTLNRLLAPISGGVYLQLAKMLKEEAGEEYRKQAEEAAHRANEIWAVRVVRLKIQYSDDYPERIGDIFKELDNHTQAIKAYCQAAKLYVQRGDKQRATSLLERAEQLSTDDKSVFCDLSYAWLMSSARSEPPYVDEHLLAKSIAAWESCNDNMQRGVGDPTVYVIRALINSNREYIPQADRWGLRWEAVTYLEAALVVQPPQPDLMYWLGYFHIPLENRVNAIEALRKTIAIDPQNADALRELALLLAEAGYFSESENLISRYRELSPDFTVEADALKAYVLAINDEYEAALELFDRAIAATQTKPQLWQVRFRAFCSRILAKREAAEKDYRDIWSRYTPDDSNNQATFAEAAYYLGVLGSGDKAARYGMIYHSMAILSSLRDDPSEARRVHRLLGLCYLVLGDLAEGEQELAKGIELANNITDMDELTKSDFKALEEYSATWPHRSELAGSLDRLRERVLKRRAELENPLSAIEELEGVAAILTNGAVGTWAWVGIHASLARLYAEAEQWQQAADGYDKLLENAKSAGPGEHANFPEVYRGGAKVQAQLAFAAAARADLQATEEHMRRSLELRTEGGMPASPNDVLAELPNLITSIEQSSTLREAIQALSRAAT